MRIERDTDVPKYVITGYDQSKEGHAANSPLSKKTRISKYKVKTMLISFFNCIKIFLLRDKLYMNMFIVTDQQRSITAMKSVKTG